MKSASRKLAAHIKAIPYRSVVSAKQFVNIIILHYCSSYLIQFPIHSYNCLMSRSWCIVYSAWVSNVLPRAQYAFAMTLLIINWLFHFQRYLFLWWRTVISWECIRYAIRLHVPVLVFPVSSSAPQNTRQLPWTKQCQQRMSEPWRTGPSRSLVLHYKSQSTMGVLSCGEVCSTWRLVCLWMMFVA